MNSFNNTWLNSSRLPLVLAVLFFAWQINIVQHSHAGDIVNEPNCQLCIQLKTSNDALVDSFNHELSLLSTVANTGLKLYSSDSTTPTPSARAPPTFLLV
jgi:hypothetical protein